MLEKISTRILHIFYPYLHKCKTCKGRGKIEVPYRVLEHWPAKTVGYIPLKKTCPDCNGTGRR